MRIRVMGRLGDALRATGLVRCIGEQRPDEMIRILTTPNPELWRNNQRLNIGNLDEGRLRVIDFIGGPRASVASLCRERFGIEADDLRPEIWPDEELDAPVDPIPSPSVAIDTWASWPTKRWPIENFHQLARRLMRLGWSVVEIGRHADGEPGFDPRPLPSTVSYMNKLSVRRSAAVLRTCDVYMGCDSGPFHLAAAVGTPQVIVYGSTQSFGLEYADTITIKPGRKCFDGCLNFCVGDWIHQPSYCVNEITVEQAIEGVERALELRSCRTPGPVLHSPTNP